MSDLIRIVDLEVHAHLGVPEDERAHPQRLLVTLALEMGDFGPAARADDIALTLDYSELTEQVKRIAAAHPRQLLETFASDLADELLAAFPIHRLRLEVKKFVLPNTRYVSVEIERAARKP
jgi:dihydroneopterin aldolase